MSETEHERVSSLSDWYLKDQLDFDKRLIRFRYETIKPMLVGERGLELGSAEGEMTRFLMRDFAQLTVVEAAPDLLANIPEHKNLVKIQSLFEDFSTEHLFDSIIAEHVLEHVEDPVALLTKIKTWLAPSGRLFLGVPNGHSIHRLAAVKMGLLSHPCQLNQRDHALGHRRVYTPQTLADDIRKGGLRVLETGGVFLKPVSNTQIQEHWTEQMIQGFFALGKDFPDLAAEIYAVCVA